MAQKKMITGLDALMYKGKKRGSGEIQGKHQSFDELLLFDLKRYIASHFSAFKTNLDFLEKKSLQDSKETETLLKGSGGAFLLFSSEKGKGIVSLDFSSGLNLVEKSLGARNFQEKNESLREMTKVELKVVKVFLEGVLKILSFSYAKKYGSISFSSKKIEDSVLATWEIPSQKTLIHYSFALDLDDVPINFSLYLENRFFS